MNLRWLSSRVVRVVVGASLLFGSGAVVLATAAPAEASVSCYGDYCSGRDPQATGCANDAVTFAVANLSYGTLQLRWSPTCKTEWARLYVYPTRTLAPGWVTATQPSTGYTVSGGINAISSWSPQTETVSSPMVYSPVRCVKAGAVLGTGYSWNYDWTACV
jgi:hypothetical protein